MLARTNDLTNNGMTGHTSEGQSHATRVRLQGHARPLAETISSKALTLPVISSIPSSRAVRGFREGKVRLTGKRLIPSFGSDGIDDGILSRKTSAIIQYVGTYTLTRQYCTTVGLPILQQVLYSVYLPTW